MGPVGTPIIPGICTQRCNLCTMYHPQCSTRVCLYLKRFKRKKTIAYHIVKIITTTIRNIQSPEWCLAVTYQACKACMNQIRKLEKVAELHIAYLAMSLLDQVGSLMCVINYLEASIDITNSKTPEDARKKRANILAMW